MSFVIWECGHPHQEGPDGRVEFCDSPVKPVWYLLEHTADNLGELPEAEAGLNPGDLTVHIRTAEGVYSWAERNQVPQQAWNYAVSKGRRLMIWSPVSRSWEPITDAVKPASHIRRWGDWPWDVEPLLRRWNQQRLLRFERGRPSLGLSSVSTFICSRCEQRCVTNPNGRAVLCGRSYCDDCLVYVVRDLGMCESGSPAQAAYT